MMFVLYANALQLISTYMFKSGGTKKKTDIEATLDTINLFLAMLQVQNVAVTCSFVGLDLVIAFGRNIDKKEMAHRSALSIYLHIALSNSHASLNRVL